jgi:NADH-quinone oxidoreductase subunit I/electron transport complex protein RnfC
MTKKLDSPNETSGIFTVQYPEEHYTLPEAARNFPILLYEDASGQELCTSCFQCQRICPPQVIHITQAKDPVTGKAVPAAAEFLIEYDACMSCGLCAEVCPFDAIKMDHEFELATDMHGDLTIDRIGLLRPISYYEQLAPSFWAEVKDGALKKLQGAAKRRSGSIGIAPQSREPTTERQELRTTEPQNRGTAEPRTERQEPRTTEPSALIAAPAIADTAPAATTLPPVPVGDAKVEKAAKLAAIRAANTKKDGGATQASEPTVEAVAPPVGDAKADKAAKLAAIRAANAKKEGVAAPAVVAPTDVPHASAAPVVAEASPVVSPSVPVPGGDAKAEKAAKLAAIRAANAKKNENPEGTP